MNLPSTTLRLEVAKIGDEYVVNVSWDNGVGSIGGTLTEIVRGRELLVKYLGLMVNYVPQ